MVNLTMPSDPATLPTPPAPDSKQKRNWKRLIYYLFFLLLVVLAIAGLWYIQTSNGLLR